MDRMNLKPVEVVIIILTLNQKENTLKCLESLSHIDFHSWEIILVENGSSDGTAEEVLETFPEVNIIKNDYNLGVSAEHNIGIKYKE
jgi:GT2 family glycosyltransferase